MAVVILLIYQWTLELVLCLQYLCVNCFSSLHKDNRLTIVVFPHNFQQGVSNVTLERKRMTYSCFS